MQDRNLVNVNPDKGDEDAALSSYAMRNVIVARALPDVRDVLKTCSPSFSTE